MTDPIAGYQQGVAYNAETDRRINNAAVWSRVDGASLIARDGILSAETGINFSAGKLSGTWAVSVERGNAMVGGYAFVAPVGALLAHDAATSTARRDLIILRVQDIEAGDTVDSATVEIVKGTSTADPAIPPRSLIIAHVTLRANATSLLASDITDRRTFTAAVGGVVLAQGTPSTVPANLAGAGIVYDYQTDLLYRNFKAPSPWTGLLPMHTVTMIYQKNNWPAPNNTPSILGGDQTLWGGAGDQSVAYMFNGHLYIVKGGVYTITWQMSGNRTITDTSESYLQMYWTGSPDWWQQGLSASAKGCLSVTCYIGAGKGVQFLMRQESGAVMGCNNTFTITRHP